jgi:hypothetical protein
MKRWVRAWIVLFGLLASSQARADFFELSPGPLTTAHSELDKTDQCTKCHDLGKGVTNFLCLDCHQHRPLRDAIAKGNGLHATFTGDCRTCHTEHKGRDALIVDWSAIGGRQGFDHKRTGFNLTGEHEKVACTACHKRKLKSGRNSFIDVSRDCDVCHKNPHKFTSADLRSACTKCHKGGVARKIRSSDLFFDHEKRSGLALVAKHGQIDCVRCHQNAKMSMPSAGAAAGRKCASCHKSPHGKAFIHAKCETCHAVEKAWAESPFDHDTTGFALRNQHKTKNCAQCHKKEGVKPKPVCESCHGDPHSKRFEGKECKTCHGLGGSKKALVFNHDKETKFALTAKHKELACRKCHRGDSPKKFEKFATPECMKCHRHTNAHNGEFKDKPCLECHKEGGSLKLKFNHLTDARFKTTGFHGEVEENGECRKCHPKGSGNQFRTNKLNCIDCHKDSHNGELGNECNKCHRDDLHFKETAEGFDHDHKTRFVRILKHKETKCEKCHENRHYKTGKLLCFDCHEKDDKHELKLGKACDKCHTPTKGAPQFDHEKMTAFARTGKHLDTKCYLCHRASWPGGVAPKVGWGKTFPAEELDRKFPTPGKQCISCHFDRHEGAYGAACDGCHDTKSFANTSRAVHDTGAFRLEGTHDVLPCVRCHQPGRPLTGLGTFCGRCHRETDVHNNALGEQCGQCHSQIDWKPARFNHATVGFPLRGQHMTARCTDCHTFGLYGGTPRDCAVCHVTMAMRVPDPVHNGAMTTDCQNCHTEVSFAIAKHYHPFYPLTGQHVLNRCSSCHIAGVYVGTPRECFGCHRTDYLNPANKPNHVQAGYSEVCEDCHTTAAWMPARMPR